MTKYCPVCESEYQDSVEFCADDNEPLLDAPVLKLTRERSIDVYAASNEIEAKLVIAILSDLDIPSQLFRPQISQMPLVGETHFVIAVHDDDRALALENIRIARNDGVLPETGVFL